LLIKKNPVKYNFTTIGLPRINNFAEELVRIWDSRTHITDGKVSWCPSFAR
jgi:hypothetical protein